MSITIRPYRRGGWEVDIRVVAPDGVREIRERKRAPTSARSAAVRWAESRERVLFERLMKPPQDNAPPKEVPSLRAFASRFLDGHARADRQKGSGIAAKEVILRVHLVPALGHKKIDAITSEDVQHLKGRLSTKAAKTVNNILTVLNVMLKKAVEWNVIDRVPCTIRLLRVSKSSTRFYDFEEFERLIVAARATDSRLLILAIQTGLRVSELIHLRCGDVTLGTGAHVRCEGKGRKQRCTPLLRETATLIAAWLRERNGQSGDPVFPTARGATLSRDAVERLVIASYDDGTASLRVAQAKARQPARLAAHRCDGTARPRRGPRRDRTVARSRVVETTQMYLHADMRIKEQRSHAPRPPVSRPAATVRRIDCWRFWRASDYADRDIGARPISSDKPVNSLQSSA